MEQGNGLIVYPRRYNLRGKAELHSVFGVTPEGLEVNVKLRVPKEYLKEEAGWTIPRVGEFARTDIKAKMPCIATEANGPGPQREGMLIFSAVQPDDTVANGYVAGWASVLAESANSPEPIVGWGRMEIERNTRAVQEKLAEIAQLEARIAAGGEGDLTGRIAALRTVHEIVSGFEADSGRSLCL